MKIEEGLYGSTEFSRLLAEDVDRITIILPRSDNSNTTDEPLHLSITHDRESGTLKLQGDFLLFHQWTTNAADLAVFRHGTDRVIFENGFQVEEVEFPGHDGGDAP